MVCPSWPLPRLVTAGSSSRSRDRPSRIQAARAVTDGQRPVAAVQLSQLAGNALPRGVVAERLQQVARALEVGEGLVTIAHGGAKPRVLAVDFDLAPTGRLSAPA